MYRIFLQRYIATALILTMTSGCVGGAPKYTTESPDFQAGMVAINNKDFKLASYHFAEIAKYGNPSAMNNLGVALFMVGREDEAIFWFSKASRYGDVNARDTLAKMGYAVPAPDLVGKHPTQLQREATEQFVQTVVFGLMIGVSIYYVSKANAYATPVDNGYKPSNAGNVGNCMDHCRGYAGPGGPCYAGPGGPAYAGPGGGAYDGPGGACYAGPGGGAYAGPGGPAYTGPGGGAYDGPGGAAYAGVGGACYSGPGGPCYAGPGGGAYAGPGGGGKCPNVCR